MILKYINQVLNANRQGKLHWARNYWQQIKVCLTLKSLHCLINWMAEQWKESMSKTEKKTTELDHCNWSIFQDRKIYSYSWPSPITLIFSVTCVIFFIIYKEIKATYLVQASLNHSRMNHSFCSQCDMWKPAYIESSFMAFWLFCTAYVFNIYHLNTYKSFHSVS